MKVQLLSIFLFCSLTVPLLGQLSHRNLIIEGSAATQFFATNNNSDFLISASPTISYFITDKFVAGGGVQIATVPGTGTNFGINGITRYYFSSQANNAWFAETNIGFLTGGNFTVFTGDVGLGLDLFLSPNIALENTLSIGFQKEEGVINNTVIFQLGTGLKFFFDRKPLGSPEGRNGILQKGSLFLGMTAGNIQIFSRNGMQNSNITLSPNIGKFLTSNWVVGANMTIQNSSFNGANFFTLAPLPYLRYYQNAGEKRAVLFGEVGGGIQLTAASGDFLVNQTDIDPTFFGGIGVDYFLRPTIAFEIKGFYRYFKQGSFINTNTLGVNFGFQFFFRKSE